MKKKDIISSYICIAIGIAMIIIGLTIDIEYYYASMIFSMGVGCTTPSVVWLIRHIHDTKPENLEAYREKVREQNINMKDERKNQIRHLAGYITWLITIIAFFLASFIAAWLRADKMILAIFFIVAVLEYIVALIIYKYLCMLTHLMLTTIL